MQHHLYLRLAAGPAAARALTTSCMYLGVTLAWDLYWRVQYSRKTRRHACCTTDGALATAKKGPFVH